MIKHECYVLEENLMYCYRSDDREVRKLMKINMQSKDDTILSQIKFCPFCGMHFNLWKQN